jgi:hypothetical protein
MMEYRVHGKRQLGFGWEPPPGWWPIVPARNSEPALLASWYDKKAVDVQHITDSKIRLKHGPR